ncbi:MAG: hypothetical protein GXO63_00020 [Candidatus Micrarchaeota archaeon]|nr:hypothetical protein [Candidatus Micrarchaeota archaeon]
MNKKKILLKDDVFSPQSVKTIEYTGPGPSRLIKSIPGILKDVLKIGGSGIYHTKLSWDASGNPVSFKSEWYAKYGFDDKTTLWIKVNISGKQDMKTGNGSVTILLTGWVETKISFPVVLSALADLYSYVFYSSQRRKYLKEARVLAERVEDEIRASLNLIRRGGV